MKYAFRDKRFNATSQTLLANCQIIVEEYQDMSIKLTLRQLYYQLVSRDLLANRQDQYEKLSRLVTDGRYCGYIDWNAIEDRVRVPKHPLEYDDLEDLLNNAVHWYRLPRWADQEYYVEVFTEKDALASVLEPMANKWHVTFCVNRGYASATAMYDTFNRFARAHRDNKKQVLLYLGDHDPSGLDMVRDIKDRLNEFGVDPIVRHIALTWDQIEEYDPPPNPTKLSDSRARAYIAQYGDSSWEVDALPPDVMHSLVEEAVKEFVDEEKMDVIKAREVADKSDLRAWVLDRKLAEEDNIEEDED